MGKSAHIDSYSAMKNLIAALAVTIHTVALADPSELPRAIYADPPADPGGQTDTFMATELDSNHGFDDRRIALEVCILDWLAKLPGGPPEEGRR